MIDHEHFVVLGAARPRTSWLTDVGQWSTSSALPIEFIRCVSIDEVRSRLMSDRRHSAVLLGEDCAGVDRDILETARDAKCAAIVIADGTPRRDWRSLGAATVITRPFTPDELLASLREHAMGIERRTFRRSPTPFEDHPIRGCLITVLGAGGTGTSIMAMAIAGQLASGELTLATEPTGSIALIDASLNGDQARLHDLGDVVPGLPELVDLHRMSNPTADDVRQHCWFSPRHGYDVLPGLRRHRDWTILRRRATVAALASLRHTFDVVVADTDSDLEGEAQTGSIDIEDRNVLARELAMSADLVILTARGGVAGTSRSIETLRHLIELGVDSRRVLIVVLGAPRSTRGRSELTRTITSLLNDALPDHPIPIPVMIPIRRDLEPVLHDGAPPPRSVVGSITAAITQLFSEVGPLPNRASADETPIAIIPGYLGRTA